MRAGLLLVVCAVMTAMFVLAQAPAARAAPDRDVIVTAETRIDPSRLIVRPRTDNEAASVAAPTLLSDPVGWIRVKQQAFYESMSGALRAIRGQSQWSAAFMLMAMSFAYGVLHAAGPGHGKAVVSAWVLANERELRRGILIACMAAVFQALTAIVLVSALLLTVHAAGSAARGLAATLESASYALIALLGLYLIAQSLRAAPATLNAQLATQPAGPHAHAHAHAHGHAHACAHDHAHDHRGAGAHDGGCASCGHSHMPSVKAVAGGDWSLTKAVSVAFAVGLRPCTGAILVLLFSSAMGLYWAGIASTLAMAVGTALTVSVIAVLAVTSRRLALKVAGRDSIWLSRTVVGLKLAAGLAIAGMGGLLFWASLGSPAGLS
jgi:nickel/cobalt transporter (NicO) family protein